MPRSKSQKSKHAFKPNQQPESARSDEFAPIYGHHGRVFGLSICAQTCSIASASEDSTARVWSLTDGQQQHVMIGHTAEVLRVAWHPNGAVLATGSADGSVKLWGTDTHCASCRTTIADHSEEVYYCDWEGHGSSGSAQLITASGKRVAVWDVAGGAATCVCAHTVDSGHAHSAILRARAALHRWRLYDVQAGTRVQYHGHRAL